MKKYIAAEIADEGGRWDEHIGGITKAYNSRPNSYSTVPPDDVLDNKVADFKILQKNAKFFDINNKPNHSTSKAADGISSFPNCNTE